MDCRANIPAFDASAPWHIALTLSGRHDAAAELALRNRRYQVYRPIMPRQHIERNRLVDGDCSMFPGYLFVADSAHQGWEALRSSPGVAYFGDGPLLKVAGRIAMLDHDDPQIAALRECEKSLWIAKKSEPRAPVFRIGDRVHIKKGPWVELWGEIESLDGPARVGVLLDILKRRVRAFVSPAYLVHAIA